MIEGVSKLRALPNFGRVTLDGEVMDLSQTLVCVTRQELDELADAIEREVKERYIELPKDADGEYIRIGDRVEDNERVVRIVLTNGSWEPSVYVEKAPCLLEEYFCNEVSHYHEPTVEDVLREFALEIDPAADVDVSGAKTIAEYAAKLKLREAE